MTYLQYTDFRNGSKEYFDSVAEKGASYVIIRHGKPIATLSPYVEPAKRVSGSDKSWQQRMRERKPITLRGEGLNGSETVIAMREESPY